MKLMQNKNIAWSNFEKKVTSFILAFFVLLNFSAILTPAVVYATPTEASPCSEEVTGEQVEQEEQAKKEKCKESIDCTEGTDAANCGITRYLIQFINLLSGLVIVVVVGVLISAGIQYSMSAGDPQAVAAAKKRISNALLAIVVYAATYGFLQWIVPGGVF